MEVSWFWGGVMVWQEKKSERKQKAVDATGGKRYDTHVSSKDKRGQENDWQTRYSPATFSLSLS
jgi:hypothetical protein